MIEIEWISQSYLESIEVVTAYLKWDISRRFYKAFDYIRHKQLLIVIFTTDGNLMINTMCMTFTKRWNDISFAICCHSCCQFICYHNLKLKSKLYWWFNFGYSIALPRIYILRQFVVISIRFHRLFGQHWGLGHHWHGRGKKMSQSPPILSENVKYSKILLLLMKFNLIVFEILSGFS